ncbi:peroxide stress protein YaaA [Legionella sp. PC997]|uniref:peroxide stress protein YaaA n=1 Tax=Legionella sp. PC997 TaxID=2755562 RepID=UPI0015FBE789|nr:peroxide stress protein YaaA [Legionella sp. PC997]QMT60505.1 peroxide stress protein YaaA [Legionella sp. PC997]
MLILLSPAKKLLTSYTPYSGITSNPMFVDKTNTLVGLMKSKSIAEIASLMDLSKDLAELNYKRYHDYSVNKVSPYAYPALFLFQGDVYQGLKAESWDQPTIDYSQNHLRILSGLYGMLRPLDNIQPYRLEMGVHLQNPAGKNLYEFWQKTVTQALNQELAAQKNPVLINLASNEYVKAVDSKELNYPLITINFYEKKNDQLKMIGIHAKKARGTIARFLVQNQLDDLEQLKQFNELGYKFHESTSAANHLDFVREAH